jgi:hypothetical protein
MKFIDPYANCDAVKKLRNSENKKKRILCIDRDGTLNFEKPPERGGDVERWQHEVNARRIVRETDPNNVIIIPTMCTPGMLMSWDMFDESAAKGYNEPRPRIGYANDGLVRIEAKPGDVPEFAYNTDADVIAGIGTRIMIKNGSCYFEDRGYVNKLGLCHYGDWSNTKWRATTMRHLRQLWPEEWLHEHLAKIDLPGMYEQRLVNVAQLPGRVELSFDTIDEKHEAIGRIITVKWRHDDMSNFVANRLDVIDESRPPKGKIFLVPRDENKYTQMERCLRQISSDAGLKPAEIEVFCAGDASPDLNMIRAVPEAKGRFVLVGGSRLTQALVERHKEYAGVSIEWLTANLVDTDQPGIYKWQCKVSDKECERLVIVGDEAFPGTTGPVTIAKVLESL